MRQAKKVADNFPFSVKSGPMTVKRIPWYQPVPTPQDATHTERFAVWGRNFFALPSKHRYTTIALRILACMAIIPPLVALVGKIIYAYRKEDAVIPGTPVGSKGPHTPRVYTVYRQPGEPRVKLQKPASGQASSPQSHRLLQSFVPVPLMPPSTPKPLRFDELSSSDEEYASGNDSESSDLRLSSSDSESD